MATDNRREDWWAGVLELADALPLPHMAEELARGLPAGLQRLVKICLILAMDDRGDEVVTVPFVLGVHRAGLVVGGDSLAGSAALRELQGLGIIRLLRRGRPGKGVSVWEWTARPPARVAAPALRLYEPDAVASAARN